jgi:uncharacterized protein (UPF0332 family)
VREEVGDLLEKSERSFGAAELLLSAGEADFAASRAYYGYFYVTQGLLIQNGVRPRSHAGVVGQYGLHFAKTGVLDPRFGRLLDRALTLRQLADYGTKANAPSPEDVRRLVDEGRSFLRVPSCSRALAP